MKNQQYELEYNIRSSPTILFNFLSTASGLGQWFADKVISRDKKFVFTWNGSDDEAEVVELVEEEYIKFHWDGTPEDEFFSFEVKKSEVTNDTILIVNDFAPKSDIDDQKLLWDSQIAQLTRVIGGA